MSELFSVASNAEEQKKVMLEKLAPINLDPVEMRDYNRFVFPDPGNKVEYSTGDQADMLAEIMKLSLQINSVFAAARVILSRGDEFEDDPEFAKTAIANLFERISGSVRSEEYSVKSVVDSMQRLLAGDQHVIQPSKKHKGGYDIVFSGTPRSGGCGLIPTDNASLIANPEMPQYETVRLGKYSTELSLAVLFACEKLLKALLGPSFSLENAHKRHVVQLPLDYDFEQFNSLFRSAGIEHDLFFKNITLKTPELAKYYSIVLVVEADHEVVDRWFKHLEGKSDKPDNKSVITREQFICGTHVRTSYALTLNKEICKYITQSEELEMVNYCLNSFASSWVKTFGRHRKNTGNWNRATRRSVPRYILATHKTTALQKLRKEAGFHTDSGRANSDGITIGERGNIMYLPNASELDPSISLNYEKDFDKLLAESFKSGLPLLSDNKTISPARKEIAVNFENTQFDEQFHAIRKDVSSYSGALLSYSWDLNIYATVSDRGTSINAKSIEGACAPSDIMIADMLGFDFRDEGENKIVKSFYGFIAETFKVDDRIENVDVRDAREALSTLISNQRVLDEPLSLIFLHKKILSLFEAYSYFSRKGVVKSVADLIKETKLEMGLTSKLEAPLERNLCAKTVADDFSLRAGMVDGNVEPGHIVLSCLLESAYDSLGGAGSNLQFLLAEEVGQANIATEIQDHPSHFNPRRHRLSDFSRLYTYFGGRLFRNMCLAITSIPRKELIFTKRSGTDTDVKFLPSFELMSTCVMPMAVIYSKYVPNYLEYFDKAEKQLENLKRDESIDASDIQAPGLRKGLTFMPHQLKAQQTLRKRPKFAILDIHPGGGKTLIGLTDILCLYNELKGNIRPVVIAPNGLVRNWCDEIAFFTEGSWNAIPLTTQTMNEWGPDEMIKVITEAPKNTILVAGLSFLAGRSFDISFGPKSAHVYGGVEIIKLFNPNYLLLDESHKAKSFDPEGSSTSVKHSSVKALFTMSGIEYARLATGTLVHNVLTDVVGQAALFNSYIYKTPTSSGIDFNAQNGPLIVRRKLSKYCAVITMKRKEWAFMLPNPIDSFLPIQLTDGNTPGNELHAAIYHARLLDTLEEVAEALKKAKQRGNSSGESDDTLDIGAEDNSDYEDDFEEGEELAALGTIGLQTYFQEVEQLVNDPWGDRVFREEAEKQGIKEGDFMPAKIAAVIRRLDAHFKSAEYKQGERVEAGTFVEWQKGMVVREFDVVTYEGEFYMRRRLPLAEGEKVTITRKEAPPSLVPPSEDITNWKPEKHGKVIIFCRYKRSINSIYAALPAEYKAVTKRFHGSLKEEGESSNDNLNAFKTDPNIKILIAMEQGMAEGHNLQVGSRIIRVDTPWSPGDYEQSTARIFRPDPSASKIVDGKPGDMAREVIYIDWLMVEGSTESAKVARLMWKNVSKVAFDEVGNPVYDVIRDLDPPLEPIRMSLELLSEKNTIEDFADYFKAKALLANIEAQEFGEMRLSTVAEMIGVDYTAPTKEFEEMQRIPIADNQKIEDTKGFGLMRFNDWIAENPNIVNEPEKLTLMPVKTGFGTGVIVNVRFNYTTVDGEKVIDPVNPVSRVKVRYKANDEISAHGTGNIFVATKLTPDQYDEFFSTDMPWSTETERKRIEAAAQREQERIERETREAEERAKKNKKTGERVVRTEGKVKIRKDNEESGRPINSGVRITNNPIRVKDEVEVVDTIKPVRAPVSGNLKVKMIPTFFNGFYGLHVTNNDGDAPALKKFDFLPQDDFVYIDFKQYRHYEAFLDWLEGNGNPKKRPFSVDGPTEERLSAVIDAFEDTGRMGFNARLAAKVSTELTNFFRTRMRKNSDTKKLIMYSIVMHDRVRIAIDLKTNPHAARLVGKQIPNAGPAGVWKEHPGMYIFLAANRRLLLAKLKEVQKSGINVTNAAKVTEAVANLKVK